MNFKIGVTIVYAYCLALIVNGLSEEQKFRPSSSELLNSQVYPQRTIYGIKSIQTDNWKLEDIVGNGAGGVVINYPWSFYESVKRAPPCAQNEEEYEGHCFQINAALDSRTKQCTDNNLIITGVLIMVPDWARIKNTNCKLANKVFCAPDDGTDFGRFAGFLAKRYNGNNGKGRIVDFVIHNEVNSGEWFNIGCGNGITCNPDTWVNIFASSYVSAFDQIRKHQPKAPVLISLEHHFDYVYDSYLSAKNPFMSGKTFLQKLAPLLGSRSWAVAYHSYPPDLLRAEFSANDLPKITFGNLNMLVGWLMQTFPSTPSAWRVYLTENGINSLAPYSTEDKQDNQLCQAFKNIINTPFIESFVYHRMKDHPVETQSGLGLGLVDADSKYKKAWNTWALSNRFDIGTLKCGFENLPYLLLKRGFKDGIGHWATTRDLPTGYVLEKTYKILREPRPDTRLLYECKKTNNYNYVSIYMNCDLATHLGPLGYVYINSEPNTVALHKCIVPSSGDNFISTNKNCEGQKYEGLLGYVFL